MNVVDSEVVAAILQQQDYQVTEDIEEARPGTGQYLFHQGQCRTAHPGQAQGVWPDQEREQGCVGGS